MMSNNSWWNRFLAAVTLSFAMMSLGTTALATDTPRGEKTPMTGGWQRMVQTDSGTDLVLCYTDTAAAGFTWTVPANVTAIDYLVVGGGGAGGRGARGCGGGGGGGVEINAAPCIVMPNDVLSIKVGAGGAVVSSGAGNNGGASSIANGTESIVSASGGGGGGLNGSKPAQSGANGGGGRVNCSGAAGMDGGYAGGNGGSNTGGGGGGAGGNGGNGSNSSSGAGGTGGLGVASSITGEEIRYAGGGGGGGADGSTKIGVGTDGGGDGSRDVSSSKAKAGEDGRGGGGGGDGHNSANFSAGKGGDGTVIIRYTMPAGDFVSVNVTEDANVACELSVLGESVANGDSVYKELPIVVTATPEVGYEYTDVPEGWTRVGDTRSITREFTAGESSFDIEIPAAAAVAYTLTVNSNNHGTVQPSETPGVLGSGKQVTFTAMPNEGFHFAGWLVNGVRTAWLQNPLSFMMDADKTVTPVFTLAQPLLANEGYEIQVGEDDVFVFTDTSKALSFMLPDNVYRFEYLVVGGGGGGGGGGSSIGGGGGGGGGGVVSNTTPYVITEGTTLTITVGTGGTAGAGGSGGRGGNGGESKILFGDDEIAKALGGGGGAGGNQAALSTGANGGGGNPNRTTGGTGVAGNNGGNGNGGTNAKTGGGGAGAGRGGDAPVTTGTKHAGNGGEGVYSWITGEAIRYAGGGGGGKGSTGSITYAAGLGGEGGGGNGGSDTNVGNPGTDGLGGGGGGVGNSSSKAGGAGGSGVVIIRYATNQETPQFYNFSYSANPAAGGTVESNLEADSYPEGMLVKLTATENDGYTFTGWTTNGVPAGTEAELSFPLMFDTEAVANFSMSATVTLTINNDGTKQDYVVMVNDSPVEGTLVPSNMTVTVVATPESGYKYYPVPTGWTLNQDTGAITRDFLTETDPTVIDIPDAAEIVNYDFAITTPENGTIAGDAQGSYEMGTPLTLTATPAVGYRFTEWTVNGETAGTENPIVITLNANTTVAAVFTAVEIPNRYIRVEYVSSTSTGKQYFDTGIKVQDKLRVDFDMEWEKVNNYAYMMGAYWSSSGKQYVLGISNSGAWRGGLGDNATGAMSGLSAATVGTRYSIEALFNGPDYTLTVKGTLSTKTAGTQATRNNNLYLFDYNPTAQTRYPAWAKLYSCQMFTNATSSTSGVLAREFLPVYDNETGKYGFYDTVTGTFYESASGDFIGPAVGNQLTITAEHGSVTGTAPGLVIPGSTVTLNAAPDPDYMFAYWTMNGVSAGTEPTLEFEMPDEDVAVVAYFELLPPVQLSFQYDSSKVDYVAKTNGVEVETAVLSNATVTVEATAKAGYEYTGSLGGWTRSASGTISREFTADVDPTVIKIPTPLTEPVAYEWGWSNVVETAEGRDCVIAFTNVNRTLTFQLPENVRSFDYLLVGGGGAGGSGWECCGGGGGGGVATNTVPYVVWSGDTLKIKAGAGGDNGSYLGGKGGNSTITVSKSFGLNEVLSIGGGGGGSGGNNAEATAGVNGGGGSKQSKTGATGTSGRKGADADDSNGGGGAGAGASGARPNGGAGVAVSITGAEIYYGGGGGGGGNSGAGGIGGGGKGGKGSTNGTSGTDGLGGGGGGGDAYSGAGARGGKGGDGIVIIRYSLDGTFFPNSIRIESSGEEFAADSVQYGWQEVSAGEHEFTAPEFFYINGADESASTSRARCLGWTLYRRSAVDSSVVRVRSSGDTTVTGESATVCKAAFNGDELYLVWDWQVDFKVTVTAFTQHPQTGADSEPGGGSVDAASLWFASNSVSKLTAVADTGNVFWRWTGAGANILSDTKDDQPTFRLTEPLTLSADFLVISEGGDHHYNAYANPDKDGVYSFDTEANWDDYPSYPNARVYIDRPVGESDVKILVASKPLRFASLEIGYAADESAMGSVELEIGHMKRNTIAQDVVIRSGSKLTHSNNTRSRDNSIQYHKTTFLIDFDVGGNMTIESGAMIDTQARGFAGNLAANAHDPAVYGSRGIAYESANLNKFCCHGSFFEPFTPGFGNFTYGGEIGQEKLYGAGGCVKLTVAGTLTVNGEINAISASGGNHSFGSGGSIWLTCGTLAGGTGGLIDASAFGSSYNSPGGGRIALYQTVANDWSAWQGKVSTANRHKDGTASATPGTIYRELPGEVIDGKHAGEIIFEGRETSEVAGYTDFPGEDGVDAYEHCKLVIGNGVKVYVSTNNINQIELGQIIKIRDLVFDEKDRKCPGELFIEGVHLKVLGTDEFENDFHYNGAGWKNGDYSDYTSGSSPSIRYIPVFNPVDGVTYPGILSWRGRNLFLKVK